MSEEKICPECGEPYEGTLTEHLMKTRPDIVSEQIEKLRNRISEIKNIVNSEYEFNVELVKLLCHNALKKPLFEEKLQEVVIFHLKNFKLNLDSALQVEDEEVFGSRRDLISTEGMVGKNDPYPKSWFQMYDGERQKLEDIKNILTLERYKSFSSIWREIQIKEILKAEMRK